MPQLRTAITHFTCPSCRNELAPTTSGPVRCPSCDWRGEADLFSAKHLAVDAAETALPEDAVCVHHPRKRATAVCAGTGDYICSLCSVELNGETYGANYLAAGGKDKAAKAFDRNLPRPDNYITTYLILIFVPYVNVVMIPFAFIWIPHAFILYARSLRMRRENPLFARLMGRWRVITIPILLCIVSALWIAGVTALIYFIMDEELWA